MKTIVTQNRLLREDWLQQLNDVITDPAELLQQVGLADHPSFTAGVSAKQLFALRVPRAYLSRIRHGDPDDPLLKQVITDSQEWKMTPLFSQDPLNEQPAAIPGLLHKYTNRALLLLKGGCAIHCRYCFRRHFPYHQHPGNKQTWQRALHYLQQHTELDEVILSGGDPLMAKDHELEWLLQQLSEIPHLRRLRIHSRLPVVIPARITATLCQLLQQSPLQCLLVTHINHANEIDASVQQAMLRLKSAGVTLLNQSVLLRGVNDCPDTLAQLSHALFDAGILPYYLHVLDKVQGTAHFLVTDEEARQIMRRLLSQVSGYLVPRLTREVAGQSSKTPLDLHIMPN